MVIRQLDIVINVHLSSQRSFEKKTNVFIWDSKSTFEKVVLLLLYTF